MADQLRSLITREFISNLLVICFPLRAGNAKKKPSSDFLYNFRLMRFCAQHSFPLSLLLQPRKRRINESGKENYNFTVYLLLRRAKGIFQAQEIRINEDNELAC